MSTLSVQRKSEAVVGFRKVGDPTGWKRMRTEDGSGSGFWREGIDDIAVLGVRSLKEGVPRRGRNHGLVESLRGFSVSRSIFERRTVGLPPVGQSRTEDVPAVVSQFYERRGGLDVRIPLCPEYLVRTTVKSIRGARPESMHRPGNGKRSRVRDVLQI